MVREALSSGWDVVAVVLNEDVDWTIETELENEENWFVAEEKDFCALSSQQQSEGILAILRIPSFFFSEEIDLQGPAFLLEEIQDPGNMGTLIRTASWFGFSKVICSKGCVDIWNPKTLRASMGGVFKLEVHYVEDLYQWVQEKNIPVVVAHMKGSPLGQVEKNPDACILIGNEANGVQDRWLEEESIQKVYIPGGNGMESLNAAMTGAIFAYEWSRGLGEK
mgnify:CR=1 FL=1